MQASSQQFWTLQFQASTGWRTDRPRKRGWLCSGHSEGPAQPLDCWLTLGTCLASTSLMDIVRVRELDKAHRIAPLWHKVCQEKNPRFSSLPLKSGYYNFTATCKRKCPSISENYVHVGTFPTMDSHTAITRKSVPVVLLVLLFLVGVLYLKNQLYTLLHSIRMENSVYFLTTKLLLLCIPKRVRYIISKIAFDCFKLCTQTVISRKGFSKDISRDQKKKKKTTLPLY